MKISIVTISFNQAQFLEEAILSVLNQDYPDVEYIVVDPGSTDGSRKLIEGFRDRIDHIVFEPDSGPSDGLNKGFARASGDIFGFLNADDFLLPGALDSLATGFKRLPLTDVISGHGWLVDVDGWPTQKKHSHRFSAWRYLHCGAYLLQQSTFFTAEAFQRSGGFNQDNRTCWDGELWLDMALAGCRFQHVNEYWSCFRTYEESISGQIALDPESSKAYQWDRNRMYRQATGRDPTGLGYRFHWSIAQALKLCTNPRIARDRLFSTAASGFPNVHCNAEVGSQ